VLAVGVSGAGFDWSCSVLMVLSGIRPSTPRRGFVLEAARAVDPRGDGWWVETERLGVKRQLRRRIGGEGDGEACV